MPSESWVGVWKMVPPTGLLPILGILIGVIMDISVFCEGKMSVVSSPQFQLACHVYNTNISSLLWVCFRCSGKYGLYNSVKFYYKLIFKNVTQNLSLGSALFTKKRAATL
jgi:hypothetical protein